MSKREWFYRKIYTLNTTVPAILLISLNLLDSVHTPEPNGKSNKLPKPVSKLVATYGRRLYHRLEKMSVHRIKPIFKVGDLVHVEAFNLVSVFSIPKPSDLRIGLIISGPNYDKSYTYQDWEIIDEPMYDIQFGKELRKSIPQRFLTKVSKEES